MVILRIKFTCLYNHIYMLNWWQCIKLYKYVNLSSLFSGQQSQLLSAKLISQINQQISYELRASYFYQAYVSAHLNVIFLQSSPLASVGYGIFYYHWWTSSIIARLLFAQWKLCFLRTFQIHLNHTFLYLVQRYVLLHLWKLACRDGHFLSSTT